MHFLISYDIASDRRRRRVVHLLEGHGQRVQESVFAVDVREAQWERLARKLDSLIDLRADQWRGWRMCVDDQSDEMQAGLAPPETVAGTQIV